MSDSQQAQRDLKMRHWSQWTQTDSKTAYNQILRLEKDIEILTKLWEAAANERQRLLTRLELRVPRS